MKTAKTVVIVILSMLLLFGCKVSEPETVYHVVNAAGEEVSSFTLSQIKVGMTLKEISDMLIAPSSLVYLSDLISPPFTARWGLSDKSCLEVHFDKPPDIDGDSTKPAIVYPNDCVVTDFSIVIPEKNNNDPGFPGQWLDGTGSNTVFYDDYKKIKVGMTYKSIIAIIHRPNSINIDHETNMIVIDWLLDPEGSGRLRIEFEKVGDSITEETIVAKKITVIEE